MFIINYVQEKRLEANLTVEALAKLVGVSVRTIQNLEHPDRKDGCNVQTALMLSKYLNVPIDTLFKLSDKPKPKPTPKPSKSLESCYLYIFEDADTGVIKVGISNDFMSRMSSVEAASGRKLTLAFTSRYPSRELARAEEVRLHNLLADYRLPGEWFKLTYAEFTRNHLH